MTTTEPTTAERIVVIIEEGDLRRRADNALADLKELQPLLDAVIAQAEAIGCEYTRLRTAITGNVADDDSVDEGLGSATGWAPLWEELVAIGDRLSDQRFRYTPVEEVED